MAAAAEGKTKALTTVATIMISATKLYGWVTAR